MSVNVILDVHSKPEQQAALLAALQDILPDTRQYKGCLEVKVIVNQDDQCNIVLLEKWQSKDDYESYLGWRTETGVMDQLMAMVTAPPSIRYFEETTI